MHINIFGAGSAIAQAAARTWAKQGASFTLLDRSQEHLDIVAADLRTRGAGQVHTIAVNLADISIHANLIPQIHNSAPQNIDHAVYLFAYGTLGDQKSGEANFAAAQQEITTNFTSVASLITEIANHFDREPRSQRATIAAISSVAGDRGRGSNYIYGTAKGALALWLAGLRNRLTRAGSSIHVLTIKPGFVDTPMTAAFKKGLLWAKPETVGADIVRAVRQQRDILYTPWFWRYIMLAIKAIPERVFKKMSL